MASLIISTSPLVFARASYRVQNLPSQGRLHTRYSPRPSHRTALLALCRSWNPPRYAPASIPIVSSSSVLRLSVQDTSAGRTTIARNGRILRTSSRPREEVPSVTDLSMQIALAINDSCPDYGARSKRYAMV
ncbi:hypothetical protein GJ744_007302 [Endocarpon pusillum]|uniref:Uncharacterized protein n=1 Tax=Endocarpon pusillum TaxID=364733 RepID=A0A8H7AJ13_9EURO|nr:hypothetical protein GJ744_007302 [Endocarpon pusillum]